MALFDDANAGAFALMSGIATGVDPGGVVGAPAELEPPPFAPALGVPPFAPASLEPPPFVACLPAAAELPLPLAPSPVPPPLLGPPSALSLSLEHAETIRPDSNTRAHEKDPLMMSFLNVPKLMRLPYRRAGIHQARA